MMVNDTKRTPPVQNMRLFATVDHGYCRTVQEWSNNYSSSQCSEEPPIRIDNTTKRFHDYRYCVSCQKYNIH